MGIVVRMGVDVKYFLDEMQPYELIPILKESENQYKNDWEQTRTIARVVAQGYSEKALEDTDVLVFPWDTVKPKEVMSEDTAQELDLYAKAMEERLNGKVNKEVGKQ